MEEEEDAKENNELQIENETLNVLKSNEFTEDYKYDEENHLWCELVFHLPLMYKSMDLSNTMREVAAKSVIWEVPKIKRAITYMQDEALTLKTEGINIVEMFKYNKILDLNKLYSNDIHGIADTYGIEAAGRVLVKVRRCCCFLLKNQFLICLCISRKCKTSSKCTGLPLILAIYC